ncbi:Oligopeptide transporter 2 [Hibiscus syriacus]|uniref:Oligopeptide transporter 2 n=1 Tax=Hibiscus syriacus TaxID=106335 RepID=A0A6A2WXR3_HIBSY|nr:Oligopeptide transporter 2 [Hibiscus syriacus]
MGAMEIEAKTKLDEETIKEEGVVDESELSPIEEVRLTVPNTDDPSLPVWTFRMWFLGLFSCTLLSFLNQFFGYRTEPLVITQITVQVATLPIGRLMASALPTTKFRIPGFGSREFSLNPGPFNMKEHVLITIFANAGSAFGNGTVYAVGIVTIIKAFYGRHISFFASWLLIITTQVMGYGWAGLLRKFVVEPAHMWWPSTLVQVSLFRTLHEKEENNDGKRRISRVKFFVIALVCSLCWYIFPGYFFLTLQSISWVCLAFPHSVTAHQIGSGMNGLGIGAFTLDWTTVSSFLSSPLVSPFFAIVNVFIGYALIIYLVMPVSYWGLNLFNAKTFPIYSSDLFTAQGQSYNISSIVNDKFELDVQAYDKVGRVHLSTFFAITYGFGFATIASTVTHVTLFYGREIYSRYRASSKEKADVHTKLMRTYKDIPSWWFYWLLAASILVGLALFTFLKKEVQMPWWGLIFAAALAFFFTLPISIITATTNQTPGLNIITEYIMGVMLPGQPITNVCFKTYGYMSMAQAFIGTMLAGTVNLGVAWWLLTSIENICHRNLLPTNSPWTCPSDRVFFDASVIWGLEGFGTRRSMALAQGIPKSDMDPLINLPVLLGATGYMPPATTVNYSSWIIVGTIFNFFVFRYRKQWWQRYNYILSAALDAGVAFMTVLLYFALGIENKSLNWWGASPDIFPEHCDLAYCPTAKGISVDGCPTF